MKNLKNILTILFITAGGLNIANAQHNNMDTRSPNATKVSIQIKEKRYTFYATYVLPQRGGGRQLTSEYDLRITPDSVISFLPYFGQVHFDAPYAVTDGGIKFTSTKFTYEAKEKKKGAWEITIKPTDVKYINRLVLNISANGYGSLSINSTNRDFIRYNGYVK